MRRTSLAISILIVLSTASLVWAFSGGPPNGRTAAPGESNCSVGCHTTNPLNSGDGVLNITAPSTYTAGDTLSISVDLSKTGQIRWGFEVTVLDAANQPVGELLITDAVHTQWSFDSIGDPRQYIKHTSTGTYNGTAGASPGWTFDWAAPEISAGDITFYLAGNAANGNFFNTGDFIYTTSATVTEQTGPCCIGNRGNANNDPADDANVSDVTYLVAWLFGIPSGPPPACIEEANANGDPGENANVADVSFLVAWLFGIPSGPAPPACL